MLREVLPNLVAPVIVYTTLIIPGNILFEAALSFLGVGIPQSTPSWGGMLAQAAENQLFTYAWWMMLFPGLFLLLTTVAFNLVGDGLRDALALVGTACAKTSGPSAGAFPTPRPGGVYRTALTSFGFTDGFDPTGEYLSTSWEFYQAMLRTLVTYSHTGGTAGTTLVPDLATSVPSPTDGGLTYTFHLKPGVMFGPPVSRPITSQDIAYAFERIDSRPEAAQYAFYYDGTIVGMHQHAGPPTPISGISTPSPSTIVFHLTKPTGDFLYRLALDATAPIPQEVAKCFPTAGGYGRDLVSSGP